MGGTRADVLLVTIAWISQGIALAQSSGESLTLQQAIDLAVEHHPALRAAEANIRSASGSLTQAKSAYFPSLSVSGSVTRNDGAFVFNPTIPPRNQTYDSYTTGLQASQTLFDFGRTINRVSAGSSTLDASSLDYTASRATVIANAEVAYFGVVQSDQVVRVNEEAVGQATKHLTQAKAFYSVGRRPLFDVTKAEVDLANANVNLIRARTSFAWQISSWRMPSDCIHRMPISSPIRSRWLRSQWILTV